MPVNSTLSFAERKRTSDSLMLKYPDRVPIVVTPFTSSDPNISKEKFLCPRDLTMSKFVAEALKQISPRNAHDAIRFFINNNMPSGSQYIGVIYETDKNLDGYLYIQYTKENVFG